MPEPAITGFVPKWLRDQPPDDDESFLMAGPVPDSDPRVITRLVPKDHGCGLPARTVSRVIDLKQNLVYYAALDVSEGPKPGFADLAAVPKALRDAAALVIEPAEPGGFVIPARLPERKDTDADAVVARYAELLAAIDGHKSAEVSIGALQACRELGGLLQRDVESIDVTTYDRENAPRPTYRFTPASVRRLDKLLDGRRVTSRQTFETLTGRLEALDLGKNEFQFKLEGHKKRVKGTAAFFALSALRGRLGDTVTLEGDVVRDARSVTMTAYRVVEGDGE
ncbi:hypothetical protein R5W23_003386 [Gemmata sp. JC673]|uniref:Uncharacterized protein n=1 Tax=Gemmata algarum TaxID=2975278 RepID=A0ABU5F7W6_9BACT|nr:hypothetical protein [Gemmata algarum]MDY3561956.1 hypothetical protein [Gemmata algarum]